MHMPMHMHRYSSIPRLATPCNAACHAECSCTQGSPATRLRCVPFSDGCARAPVTATEANRDHHRHALHRVRVRVRMREARGGLPCMYD